MRVTKLIREYVKKEVTKKYDAKIEKLREEHYDISCDCKAYKKEAEELIKDAIEKCEELLSTKYTNVIVGYGNNDKAVRVSDARPSSSANVLLNTKISKLKTERDYKIENILIELELGATKSDLDELLKNA